MSLGEFVALWDDDDPWVVPSRVWETRFAMKGTPERSYLLTQPEMRMLDLKTVLSIKPRRRGRTDSMLPKRLAFVVRMERMRQGKTIRGLSRASGVDAAMLSRFEGGRIDLRIAEFDRICRALDRFPALLLERARMQPLPQENVQDEDVDGSLR